METLAILGTKVAIAHYIVIIATNTDSHSNFAPVSLFEVYFRPTNKKIIFVQLFSLYSALWNTIAVKWSIRDYGEA